MNSFSKLSETLQSYYKMKVAETSFAQNNLFNLCLGAEPPYQDQASRIIGETAYPTWTEAELAVKVRYIVGASVQRLLPVEDE